MKAVLVQIGWVNLGSSAVKKTVFPSNFNDSITRWICKIESASISAKGSSSKIKHHHYRQIDESLALKKIADLDEKVQQALQPMKRSV